MISRLFLREKSSNFVFKIVVLAVSFNAFAKTTLILVYLVILAGAIVRMTGSGMGCPDWPKCFGYLIPPTHESELQWQPGREYNAGQVIIVEEELLVATANFVSDQQYRAANWKSYDKHNYAVFNVFHTWTEYINRLLGALAGLATLVLAIWSLRYRRQSLLLPAISWLVVLGMGFQAWLGATVVYSVLAPVKITLHMLMALVIVALLLYIIQYSKTKNISNTFHKPTLLLLSLALVLTLAQIIMGTQVRELVDAQIKLLGERAKAQWLNPDDMLFLVHRSFSLLVLGLNSYLGYTIWKHNLGFSKIYWVLAIIGLEIATGIAMVYFDFPFASQPLHLFLATILFGLQTYLLLEFYKAGKSLKTS